MEAKPWRGRSLLSVVVVCVLHVSCQDDFDFACPARWENGTMEHLVCTIPLTKFNSSACAYYFDMVEFVVVDNGNGKFACLVQYIDTSCSYDLTTEGCGCVDKNATDVTVVYNVMAVRAQHEGVRWDCLPYCHTDNNDFALHGKYTAGCLETNFIACEAGQEYNATTMSCEPCPLGTYNTGDVTQNLEQCAPCPAGYVTVDEMRGGTSRDNCTLRDCPAGTYIRGSECWLCPVGTYQDRPRQTSCRECGPSSNTSGPGKDQATDCTLFCPPGKEQSSVAAEFCTACQPDFVKEFSGPGRCHQCTGNVTSNDDRTVCDVLFCDRGFRFMHTPEGPSCQPCERGQYKDVRGSSEPCLQCPVNYTTAGHAATSRDDCDRAICEPGSWGPAGGACEWCGVGSYQPEQGQITCIACGAGNTTLLPGRVHNKSCVLDCPAGRDYRLAGRKCEDCRVGFYRKASGVAGTLCVKCDPGLTTILPGQQSCVIQAGEPPQSTFQIAVRLKIRFEVRPCRKSSYNRYQLGRVIQTFVMNILLKTDARYPAVCTGRCTNVRIKFRAGCLENFARRRRATAPERQEVEVAVEAVEPEMAEPATGVIYESSAVIERAFYDTQHEERTLEENEMSFLGVDSVTATFQPVPGHGPLHWDDTPADSMDVTNTDLYYGPCPAGTRSSRGQRCVPWTEGSYQEREDGPPDGLSQGMKTIIGVSVAVSALLLLVAAIVGVVVFRPFRGCRKRQDTGRSPGPNSANNSNHNHNRQGQGHFHATNNNNRTKLGVSHSPVSNSVTTTTNNNQGKNRSHATTTTTTNNNNEAKGRSPATTTNNNNQGKNRSHATTTTTTTTTTNNNQGKGRSPATTTTTNNNNQGKNRFHDTTTTTTTNSNNNSQDKSRSHATTTTNNNQGKGRSPATTTTSNKQNKLDRSLPELPDPTSQEQGQGQPEHIYCEIYDHAHYHDPPHVYQSLDYSYPDLHTAENSTPTQRAHVQLKDLKQSSRGPVPSGRGPSGVYEEARSGSTAM